MIHKYPPDADADDMFDVDQETISNLLDIADHYGREAAMNEATQTTSLDWSRASDLLEWFGR